MTTIGNLRNIALLIYAIPLFTFGQLTNECIDQNRYNEFYQCGPNFAPVCACDGLTYRNECLSYNAYGNNYIVYSGVCQNELFFFDSWPSLVEDRLQFYMQFAFQQQYNATLKIVDTQGNEVRSKLLNNVSSDFPYIETVFLSDIEPGVYIIAVQANGVFKFQKFIKHNL